MRYANGRGLILVGLGIFVMVSGAACDPENTAAQTAIDQVADELIEEGKTLFAPTDTPVPPTETPAPPSDTPVPTEVKVGMVDEEGDCEVVDGGMGEDGCMGDLASFEVFPWEKAREPRCLRRGGMDQRAQHMAASYRGWLFPWNLPWTNRGDKLAK